LKNAKLFERASSVLPGGVNSPVRAFKSVGGVPVFIEKADGCILTDSEGNEYIDYIGSWGPMILGHCHPKVVEALQNAVRKGTSFGTPSENEVLLAEEIVQRVDSVEMVRFVNSGTEATMSAVRLARAATKRDLIIKFAGGYHGHADSFLISAGSGAASLGIPDSPGVPTGAVKDTRIVPYNDLEKVELVFKEQDGNIAGVIVEPIAGNMGVVPPKPGFLMGLRNLCDQYGALLIFDEVMTGFRVARGGAQELYSINPDLTTFGKIIGGGLPVGAYGGSSELMSLIAPAGKVYQAGTLSGNPLAMTAGLVTLQQLSRETYAFLEKQSANLQEKLENTAMKSNVSIEIQRVGSMLTIFFTDHEINNIDDASKTNHKAFAGFFHSMLENGIHLPPSGYEAWFLSAAHNDDIIDKTVKCAANAFSFIERDHF